MSDRVLIPLPGIGTLALDGETYRTALAEGAKLSATPVPSQATSAEPLFVDAKEMARLTHTESSWWEAAARNLDCPSVFVGRVRRFRVSACLTWLESVQERDGTGRARRCGAAPRANA